MMTKPMCGAYPDALFCKTYGIVGRWLFNEKGTRINDCCRNFGKGAISGSVWTGSKMGGGLRFDGTDDYIAVSNWQRHIDYNKPFSISIWVTFSAVAASYCSLIGVTDGGGYDAFEIRKSNSHRIEFVFWTSGGGANGYNWGSDVQSFVVGKQYNVTVTYNGTGNSTAAKIYLNGVSVYPGIIVNNFGDLVESLYTSGNLTSKDLWFGRRNYSTGDMPFPGTIDQIIIANRVWTQSDVNKFYRNPWCCLISSTQFQSESSQMAAMGAD